MKTVVMSSPAIRGFLAVVSVAALSLSMVACASQTDDDGDDGASTASDLTGAVGVGATLTTTARVNLRTGASTSNDIILTMPNGASLKALESTSKNGFYHVSYDGEEGWAFGVYLKSASGTPIPSTGGDDPAPDPEPVDPGTAGAFNGRNYSGVTVLWQGNWNFLVKCDSYSRSKGRVVFFCDEKPSRSFVDEGAWLAMPRSNFTAGSCGKKARVCKGTKCIVASVVEKSETTGKWEGSTAVLKALGVATGSSGCSSSFGTATGISITMQ